MPAARRLIQEHRFWQKLEPAEPTRGCEHARESPGHRSRQPNILYSSIVAVYPPHPFFQGMFKITGWRFELVRQQSWP
jgi:hypothetical protein